MPGAYRLIEEARGNSFAVFTMRKAGAEARPIKLIAGNSPFCETFFTDVVVPKENLIGRLNGGWTVAKRLLQFERSDQGAGSEGRSVGAMTASLGVRAKRYVGEDGQGRLADAELRARMVQHEIEDHALQLTVSRVAREARSNAGPSGATSVMKNATARVVQNQAELTVEIMGGQGLGWEGDGFEAAELEAVRNWLGGKAALIAGGSNEVQNNIISKRILGLPDPAPAR